MTGKQIRERRKALGLSQTELAQMIGAPGGQPYISAIECGTQTNLTMDLLYRLAGALRLEVSISLTAADSPAA